MPNICWSNAALTHNDSLPNVFHDFCLLHDLYQFVAQPTRGNNILDLVLCNDVSFVSHVNVVEPISTSDHNCIEYTCHVSPPVSPQLSVREQARDFTRADYDDVNARLLRIDWFNVFKSCLNVNDLWRMFCLTVNDVIAECMPLKRKRRQYICHLPYYIRHAIVKKRLAWRRFKQSGDPASSAKFKHWSSRVRLMIKSHVLERDQAALCNV